MTGALMKSGPAGAIAPVDVKEAAAAAYEATSGMSSQGGGDGVVYVSFSGKLGRYKVGKEAEDMDPERRFFLDPTCIIKGWNCWKDGKVHDRHKWWAREDKTNAVSEDELADHKPYNERAGEGWREVLGFLCKDLDDAETQYEFTVDRISAINSVNDLLNLMYKQIFADAPDCYPVFRFEKKTFEAQGSTNWKPVLDLDGWLTAEQIQLIYADVGYTVEDALAGKKATKAQLKKLAA